MSLDLMFPLPLLNESEQDLLVEIFSNPTVRKYLTILGTECSKDLLSLAVLNETPESLSRKHILTTGKLEVLTTLLTIQR